MVHLEVSLGEILVFILAWHFFTPIATWFGIVLYRKLRRKVSPNTAQVAPPWGRYIIFVDFAHDDNANVDGMLIEAVGFDTQESTDEFKERIRQVITDHANVRM